MDKTARYNNATVSQAPASAPSISQALRIAPYIVYLKIMMPSTVCTGIPSPIQHAHQSVSQAPSSAPSVPHQFSKPHPLRCCIHMVRTHAGVALCTLAFLTAKPCSSPQNPSTHKGDKTHTTQKKAQEPAVTSKLTSQASAIKHVMHSCGILRNDPL